MSTTERRKKPTTAPNSVSPAAELLSFVKSQAASGLSSTALHNAIFGVGGRFGQLFPTQSDRAQFAKSSEFKAISDLIDSQSNDQDALPSGKFVLRLPGSLHAALLSEAKSEGVSLNQLCLAKLSTQLRSMIR